VIFVKCSWDFNLCELFTCDFCSVQWTTTLLHLLRSSSVLPSTSSHDRPTLSSAGTYSDIRHRFWRSFVYGFLLPGSDQSDPKPGRLRAGNSVISIWYSVWQVDWDQAGWSSVGCRRYFCWHQRYRHTVSTGSDCCAATNETPQAWTAKSSTPCFRHHQVPSVSACAASTGCLSSRLA
jgi:hypothetical protein